MTPRERVRAALEFRTPDRAPRDVWALPWVRMFAQAEFEALLDEFPMDFTGPGAVLGKSPRQKGEPARIGSATDEWGCEFVCAQDGVIGEVKHPPLAEDAALDRFRPPEELIAHADWDAANRAQEKNLAGGQRFMLAGSGARPFERMQFLRGSERLFMDIAYGSKLFRRLREMIHTFELRLIERWAKTDVDAVSFMDDWGSQRSLLINPATWREVFKPMYARYCAILHDAGKKVFFHSDGYIFDIYEDLIEIGVDAVNSQLFCMDIEQIASRFKGRITFWGEIDRQHVLPFGTPADARAAVGRVRRALDDGSGGLFAQCEWGVRTPPQNLRAVYAAWQPSHPVEEPDPA